MEKYNKGFIDGMNYAKDKAIEALFANDDVLDMEYIRTRDAIRAIELPKEKKEKTER